MKNLLFLSSVILLSSVSGIAQENKNNYKKYIGKADSLYKAKEYASAARSYYKGFLEINGKAYATDRYNAACSYSLAKINDSAFYHLNYMADKSSDYLYDSYKHVMKGDSDLDEIRKDERWEAFSQRMDSIKSAKEKDLNMELVEMLDPIYEKDQGIRKEYREMAEKHNNDDPEMKAFYKKWRAVDSTNEVAITQFLDEHGWLGANVIGSKGNSTLFLVIQHSPLETQEKYLPMMQDAVKKGNARGSSLALLEDRINLRNQRHQVYGSQIGTLPETGENVVQPLADPDRVDMRRKEVGLGPISEYASRFGIKWDLEAYKKRLPELEAIYFGKKAENED